jgi:UDP-glucose 4-epimerase
MRALVTGGAGFVGSHVVEALLNEGHRVLVVDNLVTGRRENIPDGAGFVQVDITGDDLAPICRDYAADAVFHQAAQTLVAASAADPMGDARVNVLGTINVLRHTLRAGCRKFVFASSGGTVYGNPVRQPVSEDHALVPISPYGVSKVAGEHFVRVLCAEAGAAFTILRYGNVFGPRDIPASQHVITAFLDALLEGRQPVIEWDGEQSKDYVYAGDVATANVCAIERGDNEAFNIGSQSEITVNQIFKLVSTLMGGEVKPKHRSKRPGDVRRFVLDCSKAARLLDWTPQTPFVNGLARTVEYYRDRAIARAALAEELSECKS